MWDTSGQSPPYPYNSLFTVNYSLFSLEYAPHAGVVELVDTSDSKSDASNSVPVQVRPPVPINYNR